MLSHMILEGMNAPAKLRAYTKSHHLTYESVGGIVGCATQSVTQWACGASRPRYAMMYVVQELCGVMVEDWLTEDEKAAYQKAVTVIDEIRSSETKEFALIDKVSGRI